MLESEKCQFTFPADFKFGTASQAHQIEGRGRDDGKKFATICFIFIVFIESFKHQHFVFRKGHFNVGRIFTGAPKKHI